MHFIPLVMGKFCTNMLKTLGLSLRKPKMQRIEIIALKRSPEIADFSWTLQGKSACTFCVGWITPHRKEITVSTAYVRRVSLKPSLSDAEVAAYWKFTMEEVVPALQRVPGMRSVKVYSGAGGLRADIRYVFEMDDAGVYERLLATPALQPLVAKN